jgi:hypothetical protein
MLVGLGAAALAAPGHSSAGHVYVSTDAPASSSVISSNTAARPWMY